MTVYDPENWLESMTRCLKEYAEEEFHQSVRDDDGNFIGNQVYEIIMEFPETEDILKLMPMAKTIIHFEIDDLQNNILGFGEGHHRLNYDEFLRLIEPQEAVIHEIDLDVGVWSSPRSGGTTARLRAYQIVKNLFEGALATQRLMEATDNGDGGVEIIELTGGRFIQDTVNDISLFRVIDCSLKVRVFSRTPRLFQIPTVEEITQIPELIIDDQLQLPMGATWKDSGTATENAIVSIAAGDTGSGG
jgi:hypothetical protein